MGLVQQHTYRGHAWSAANKAAADPAGLKLATDVFNRNKDSTKMKVFDIPEVSEPNEIPRAIATKKNE